MGRYFTYSYYRYTYWGGQKPCQVQKILYKNYKKIVFCPKSYNDTTLRCKIMQVLVSKVGELKKCPQSRISIVHSLRSPAASPPDRQNLRNRASERWEARQRR